MNTKLSDIRQRILHGWNLIRFIRLGLALFISYHALVNYDWIFAILGGILLVQSLLNVGCCGVGGCETDQLPKRPGSYKRSVDETTFEEVK